MLFTFYYICCPALNAISAGGGKQGHAAEKKGEQSNFVTETICKQLL